MRTKTPSRDILSFVRKSPVKGYPAWSKLIRWPIFLAANLLFMFIVGMSTIRETYRGWSVDREIQALEAHAASLEGRKLQLQTLAQELVSPERTELDARARLGLRMPRERVIILEGLTIPSSSTWQGLPGSEIVSTPVEKEASNPERWWRYFFH